MSDTNLSPSFDETSGITGADDADGIDELAARRASSASAARDLDDDDEELIFDDDDDELDAELETDLDDDDVLDPDASPYDEYDDAAVISDPDVEPSFVSDDDLLDDDDEDDDDLLGGRR